MAKSKAFNLIPDTQSANGYQTLAWTIVFMLDCFCDIDDSNLNDYDNLKEDIRTIYDVIGKHQSSFDSFDEEFIDGLRKRFRLCDEVIKVAKAEPHVEQSVIDIIKGIIRS